MLAIVGVPASMLFVDTDSRVQLGLSAISPAAILAIYAVLVLRSRRAFRGVTAGAGAAGDAEDPAGPGVRAGDRPGS